MSGQRLLLGDLAPGMLEMMEIVDTLPSFAPSIIPGKSRIYAFKLENEARYLNLGASVLEDARHSSQCCDCSIRKERWLGIHSYAATSLWVPVSLLINVLFPTEGNPDHIRFVPK